MTSPNRIIEIERETDGRWIAEIPNLPGVMAYGNTEQEAIQAVKATALKVVTPGHLSVSEAVVQLRRAYGRNQQKFSDLVGVTVRTIARWEVERPPSTPLALKKLISLSVAIGRLDLSGLFQEQIPRTLADLRRALGREAIQVALDTPGGKDEIVAALRRHFDTV